MSAKQITVPLEVYVRLQELASLATYSYRDSQGSEESTANDKPWDLLSQDGASLLDENGALKPEAAELYFTLLPLIAQEFVEQQQALVDAYRHQTCRRTRQDSPLQPAPHSADRGAAGEPTYCRAHREGILR